ncbi:MAG TPA: hypothetical protein VJX92_03935, partial [Methylomirabilota bacterium]|nr:hypothetical protein [Methylomirabilota bacterium]
LMTVAILGIAVTLACADTSGPRSGINIVSGANVSDTVLSIFKPPLTVQLLDGNLQPMSGQTVYFNTNGFVLVAPIDDPGFVINRLPVTTDASGDASVWVEAKQYADTGKVVIVAPSGQSVDLYYTVLPGAPALVRADPKDTTLYVGGSETFRPYITDAYGNRLGVSPTYQYQSLNNALTISAPGKATGATIGRGSVVVSALGFTDTVWASVVPKGRLAAQHGYIMVMNLDGSGLDTIPGSNPAGRSLDWSALSGTFVLDVDFPAILVSMDMTGHTRHVVTDALMRSEFYPRYAHDGSFISFAGVDSLTNCWGVWRVHPDGTALEHVVADTVDCGPYVYQAGPSPDYASSPSPDGTRLVYVGVRSIPYVGGIIRVRTFATGADTSLGVAGDFPRWSPTGDWIAYDSLGTLMLIHPDGTGRQSLLYRGYELYFSPAVSWSPDGQWLVYHTYDRLALVQVATGLKLPLATTIGLVGPTWQP